MLIRPEQAADIQAIHALTRVAFASTAHTSHTEHLIVDELRRRGALTISLVAEAGGVVVGHVAISPVSIKAADSAMVQSDWFGLGPISVSPDRQGQGVGSALMRHVLSELEQLGANGCVLLGDPNYYGRFGFEARAELTYGDVPPEYFQSLCFKGQPAHGEVAYHAAFEVVA